MQVHIHLTQTDTAHVELPAVLCYIIIICSHVSYCELGILISFLRLGTFRLSNFTLFAHSRTTVHGEVRTQPVPHSGLTSFSYDKYSFSPSLCYISCLKMSLPAPGVQVQRVSSPAPPLTSRRRSVWLQAVPSDCSTPDTLRSGQHTPQSLKSGCRSRSCSAVSPPPLPSEAASLSSLSARF